MSEMKLSEPKEDTDWWVTNDGDKIHMGEMGTTHLFYSLRMVYNATCPEELRVGRNPRIWRIRRGTAMKASGLVNELSRREDIPDWMVSEIAQMAAKIEELKEKPLDSTEQVSNTLYHYYTKVA